MKLKDNFTMKMAASQSYLKMSYLPAQAKKDAHRPQKLVKLTEKTHTGPLMQSPA